MRGTRKLVQGRESIALNAMLASATVGRCSSAEIDAVAIATATPEAATPLQTIRNYYYVLRRVDWVRFKHKPNGDYDT